MNRASVSPLLAAFTALRASEAAERHGDMDEALKQALAAAKSAQDWADAIRGVVE